MLTLAASATASPGMSSMSTGSVSAPFIKSGLRIGCASDRRSAAPKSKHPHELHRTDESNQLTSAPKHRPLGVVLSADIDNDAAWQVANGPTGRYVRSEERRV